MSKQTPKTGEHITPDRDHLIKLANMPMPFGKYKGTALIDLPETYVIWFAQRGFPRGEIGRLLQSLYEIKLNGLETLVRPLKNFKYHDNF